MQPFYAVLFLVLLAAACLLQWASSGASFKADYWGLSGAPSTPFQRFRNNYLFVYSLMMGKRRLARQFAAPSGSAPRPFNTMRALHPRPRAFQPLVHMPCSTPCDI